MEEVREPTTRQQKIIATALTVVAMAMVVYQLLYTQILLQDPGGHRITHLGFALVVFSLSLLLRSERGRLLKWGLLLVSVAVNGYFLYYLIDILSYRTAIPMLPDLIMGVLAVLLSFITTYLVFGKTFPIVAACALVYLILGRFLPFPFAVAPVSAERLIMWLGVVGTDEGVYGDILGISANYLFLFIFFGSLLYALGGLRFIMGIAQWVGTKVRSGPAAAAVLSSSLLGTITGSTTANITITGAFTIPMMKAAGYKPEQAGAIEAAASNGGQIMPPVMGATAFIMAGFTGIPYIQIIAAALGPALIYYFGLFLYVELTARKLVIKVPKVSVSAKQLLLDAPIFIVPLGIMVFLLIQGYTLPFVAFWSMMSLIAVGLLSSRRKEARLNFKEVVERITGGVRIASEIAIMSALIGIVATSIKVSGLGMKLPLLIQDISGGHLIIALLIGMVASIILGMGVPTPAAYIMVAIGLAPALVAMGVPLLQAHLFPFIFAVFSHLTPPVAIGALIASRLAGADYWATSKEALKAAFTAFLLPFFVIYASVIILRPEGGLILSIAQIVAIIFGVVSLQMGISNYCLALLRIHERSAFLLAALLCIAFVFTQSYPLLLAGAALFITSLARQFIRRRELRATMH